MKTIRLIALALVVLGVTLLGQGHHTALAAGEWGTVYLDPIPDENNTTTGFGAIEVCRDTDDLGGPLDIGDQFIIDVVIDNAPVAAPQVSGGDFVLLFKGDTPGPAVLKVIGYNWASYKFGAGMDISESPPVTDGDFYTGWAGNGSSGDGVLVRITMEAVGNGSSDLLLSDVSVADEDAVSHYPDDFLVVDPEGDVRVVVGGTCPPTPGPTPAPTPSPTSSPTPSPEATRTLVWGPGWHNATWSGASTPEEAFACAAGSYAAAYRLVGGGWERYFPDRPEISNMTDLGQHDAFLILITGDVTCEMPVADPPGTERTLDWGVGWQNEGWTDPDGTPPQNAFACAAGSFAAAYRLVAGGWERYFPDRPDISNMGLLNRYDAFLILITAPVSCTMPIAPGGAASESPFIGAWESTDYDGSHQTLAIGGGGGGVYHVTVFDDKATTGCPETQGSATATGFGSVEGDILHVEGSVRCPSEGETYPWEADFTYDSSDDTLSGPLGLYSVQWNRIGH